MDFGTEEPPIFGGQRGRSGSPMGNHRQQFTKCLRGPIPLDHLSKCRLGCVADSKVSLTSLIELMKVELLLFQKKTLGAFEPRKGDSHGERQTKTRHLERGTSTKPRANAA